MRLSKKPAFQVHENNVVQLSGKILTARPFRYIMLHKPAQTICSNKDEQYPSVLNQLGEVERVSELHIAGRLDADTTGLLLVTDDGRWSYNITSPRYSCYKVYRVTLSRPLKNNTESLFKQGIQLQGESKLTLPAVLTVVKEREVLLTLTEGKFHQVKRMFAAVGNRVVTLHREQIGQLRLDVREGKWRYLTPLEIASLTLMDENKI